MTVVVKTRGATYEVDVLGASKGQLSVISRELGIGYNDDRMAWLQDRYRLKGRNPTIEEMKTEATLNSDHCSHFSYRGTTQVRGRTLDAYLRRAGQGRRIDDLIKLVDSGAAKTGADYVLWKHGSAIVSVDDEWAAAFRMESHNHPSAVEPVGGAATGIGGDVRDILSPGAKIVGVLDLEFVGPLDQPYSELPHGVHHPSFILDGIMAGVGMYGNQEGEPNIGGAVLIDPSFTGNPLLYAGAIGVIRRKHIKEFDMKSGDKIIMYGGRTGAKGLGGVIFASEKLDEASTKVSRPAVQTADPIVQEGVRRVVYRAKETRVRDVQGKARPLMTASDDVGGGGMCPPTCEMVYKYGFGADIDLSQVLLEQTGLKPWEVWCSESQERMWATVRPENVGDFMGICDDEEVEASVIGTVTPDKRLRLFWGGEVVGDMDLDEIARPPRVHLTAYWKPERFIDPEPSIPKDADFDWTAYLHRILFTPNICSRRSLVRIYDSEVQGNTITKVFQGVHRLEGPSDAVVIQPTDRQWGLVYGLGTHARRGRLNPYHMTASAIDESIRNATAAGGRRFALSANYAGGNPNDPHQWGQMVAEALAAHNSQIEFGAPIAGGKDSLYNYHQTLGSINPVFISSAIGIVPDVDRAVTMDAKEAGNTLVAIGRIHPELGGSELYQLFGTMGNNPPQVRAGARRVMDTVTAAIDNRLLRACHDVSDGGLAVAVSEMLFAGDIGGEIDLSRVPRTRAVRADYQVMFAEPNSCFVAEVRERDYKSLKAIANQMKVPVAAIGHTHRNGDVVMRGLAGNEAVHSYVKLLRESWEIPPARGD